MQNPRTSLVFGLTGQVVEFYPPESHLGQASAGATCSVYSLTQDLDSTAELSGSATLDSVSTTFDAASGFSQASNRDRCNLTATTNIAVGRTYLATNAYSERELVVVDAISSGAWVSKEGPLSYDYVATDTFVGLRHVFSVSDSWAADESNIGRGWRVLWSYSIGGTAYRSWTYFDLVRVRVRHTVTPEDLYAKLPDFRHRMPLDTRGQGWRDVMKEAERRVSYDIETKYQLSMDEVRSELIDRLVLDALVWVISEFHAPKGRDQTEFNTQSRIQYYADLNALEKAVAVDKGTSGGATQIGSGTTTLVR